MITEQMPISSKKYLVTGGDARVFGEDADLRRKMSTDELQERFSKVWSTVLEPQVRSAPIISLPEARELLQGKPLQYVVAGYQYRAFSIHSAVFVARLNESATTNGSCDQLWALGAHRDPTRLCLYFGSITEKTKFDDLARALGYEPKELALALVSDFAKKLEGKNTTSSAASGQTKPRQR